MVAHTSGGREVAGSSPVIPTAAKELKPIGSSSFTFFEGTPVRKYLNFFGISLAYSYLCTMTSKNLYIISGCNGAGKTTASYTVLPEVLDCREFVNADEIARGLSPFNPESVAIEAGRLMLSRIEELLERDESFSIETTLATKSYINLVRRAQAKGYQVNVLFFWLRTPELALQRVAERVANGGHNIPTDVIRRRYVAGISNLFQIFIPEVDFWNIYDNSQNPRIQIALGGREADTVVFNNTLYQELQNYVK